MWCIDFTDLKNAILKKPYPLPRIDQVVDSIAGHELLSFLDAYKGYHQVPMAEKDIVKMDFVIDNGIYSNKKMPLRVEI